jgi:phenylacetate-coenzyme A ligase PaaK-like adenylate-forming protein
MRVEPSSTALSRGEMDQAVRTFKENFKFRIGVTPELEVVKIDKLPRFEGKLLSKRIFLEKK